MISSMWKEDLRGVWVVVHPPFRTLLISDFVLQDKKKILGKCYQNDLGHLCLKFFTPLKGGFTIPPITPRGVI